MATKLKNLKITKVDFVDEGANPDADIKLFKSKDCAKEPMGESTGKSVGILKRMFAFIGKAAGLDQNEIESAIEEIQKSDSVSFNEKFNEAKRRKIADEIWDICYALQSSLCSILNDDELDCTSAEKAMSDSLEEFHTVMQESIQQWSTGKTIGIVKKYEEVTDDVDLEIMKSAVERLNKSIKKAVVMVEEPKTNNAKSKGEEEMKIDKSKLTDAERAFLDSIEKRYGVEEGSGQPAAPAPTVQTPETPPVVKSATPPQVTETPPEGQENIYKGLHPAVAAEMKELRKFREETEERELAQIAKKYVVIGKKEEELIPLFKSLKAAGGSAYSDMIAILDQTVETVEKSGVFSEIGKSGHGSGENSAETKIINIAKSYIEKDPSMSYNAAVAKAWEDHPELLSEYDEEEGF